MILKQQMIRASVVSLGVIVAAHVADATQVTASLGPPPAALDLYMPVPVDNPPTPARIDLGRTLFFDPVLSRDESIACASCHKPARAFADSGRHSRGVGGRRTTRNAPSIMNAGYRRFFFWDGRIATLEEQVLQPIINSTEMDAALDDVVNRLAARPQYREAFQSVFGEAVSVRNLSHALAAYVRTLRSGNSAVDRYAHGDESALDSNARAGRKLFLGKARCVECHTGPLFTDDRFHNTGVSWGKADTGRMFVTRDVRDRGLFRTPSLRNVALTAPYMHDGSFETLEDVVKFYGRGAKPNPNLDQALRGLRLTRQEQRELLAYLRALTGLP